MAIGAMTNKTRGSDSLAMLIKMKVVMIKNSDFT